MGRNGCSGRASASRFRHCLGMLVFSLLMAGEGRIAQRKGFTVRELGGDAPCPRCEPEDHQHLQKFSLQRSVRSRSGKAHLSSPLVPGFLLLFLLELDVVGSYQSWIHLASLNRRCHPPAETVPPPWVWGVTAGCAAAAGHSQHRTSKIPS